MFFLRKRNKKSASPAEIESNAVDEGASLTDAMGRPMPDRGLYLVQYHGDGYVDTKGNEIPHGVIKIGRRIDDLSKYGRTYEKTYTKGGPVSFEIVCKMRDRDAIDDLENLARVKFNNRRIRNKNNRPLEWMVGVSREELVTEFRRVFNEYFHVIE